MYLKRTMAKFVAAVSAFSTVAGVFPFAVSENAPVASYAADMAVIDTTTEYQTIKGFGGMNHPEWQSYKGNGDMTAAEVQTAFGNGENELGLSILRIFVSDNSNEWKNAIPTAQRAQKLGATVFATPWNPPASMRSNGSGGPTGGKYVLNTGAEEQYAKHLNNFIKYCNSEGVELNSISVQNEPDWSGEWTYWSPSRCADFLANYGKAVTAGTNTKMMSPESFSYGKDYYNAILNNSKALANCDMFGTHLYGTQRNSMDFPVLENSGKEIWMTEVYTDSEHGANEWPLALDVCTNVHNALVVGNMNAYVWWYIRRSYGFLTEDSKISKRGYCIAQFSKWIRPGDIRIDIDEQPASNIYLSAYKNENHQVTVVAVNKGSSAHTQEFGLGSGESITNIDGYRTSATENLAETNVDFSGSKFSAQLPANSVTTFVVSLEGSGKTPQPIIDDNGYIFHDEFEGGVGSWEGRGAAKVASSSSENYAGSASLSCSGRTVSWNGASKSLNTKTFKPGTAYSFSVNAKYLTGGDTETFKLTLQYTDASGEAKYSNVATATASAGQWVQLANPSYTIPTGASNLVLYVETEDSSIDFFIDEAIGAPEGTKIDGAGQPKVKALLKGDPTFDGRIDVFDSIAVRRGIINGFTDSMAEKNADVDGNGKVEAADLVLINSFILGRITTFPVPEKPDNKWDDYQETASADWINFYKSSIKSMGNVDRLAAKLEAAENGESLTLAYLGGSITEGKKYSSPFTNYVKTTFAKGQFTEVNAGLSGTSSVVGMVRSQNDIFSKNPDILFLEFSVNDHEDIMYKKCYESLVKQALQQPNDCAVVILINRSKGGFSSQEQMAAIGENYNVPIISMDDALSQAFNSGFLKPDDYFTDEYHPHDNGGKLVADCLAYFFRQAMKSENRGNGYKLPSTTVYGDDFIGCVNTDPSKISGFNAGSFSADKGYGPLPFGYSNSKNGNTPMTFKTTGKGLIIVFKANSNGMGNIIVTVNGKETKISGNKLYTWGGPDAELGYYQETSGDLDVSIKMENAGSDFTIWGIGIIP